MLYGEFPVPRYTSYAQERTSLEPGLNGVSLIMCRCTFPLLSHLWPSLYHACYDSIPYLCPGLPCHVSVCVSYRTLGVAFFWPRKYLSLIITLFLTGPASRSHSMCTSLFPAGIRNGHRLSASFQVLELSLDCVITCDKKVIGAGNSLNTWAGHNCILKAHAPPPLFLVWSPGLSLPFGPP